MTGDLSLRTICVGPIQSNAYLIFHPSHTDCVLIDAGDEPQRLLDAVQQSGKRLSAILLTHGHFDHILAADSLRTQTGAKIYIHPDDAACLRSSQHSSYMPGYAWQPFSPFDADALYADVLSVAGLDFKVLHTPGHTPGGVCLYLKQEGITFTGDTLFDGGYGRTDLPGGDIMALEHSLQTLLASLPSETRFYPGHGSDATIASAKEFFSC